MSGSPSTLLHRLPPWLAPREQDSSGRRLWRIETIVLILVGLILVVASSNDIFWSVDNSAKLVADQTTWREYTHRDYFNVAAAPLVVGQSLDVACANASPGPPGERTQICILIDGPIVNGVRKVVGGWRLPARTGDFADSRDDCFGAGATQTLCPKG